MARRGGTTVEEMNAEGALTETQETAQENTNAEGGEGGAVAEKKTRNTIDTSGVTIGDAIDLDDFGKRSTKLDTDPVAVAVRDAEIGKVVPLMVPDASKVAGVKSLARRAATRRGVGINFDDRKVAEGVVFFKVSAEKRKTKPKKDADTSGE